MPNYTLHAITVGSSTLGESDKLLTLFSAECGLIKAVAKGARKPGTKIGGKTDALMINKLLLAKGRSLDIITQAESIETFSSLRKDLLRLSYGLYYAELTSTFGSGLTEEAPQFFSMLYEALMRLSMGSDEPLLLCLAFELKLLNILGYMPELSYCITCRQVITEYSVAAFDHEFGGSLCNLCFNPAQGFAKIAEEKEEYPNEYCSINTKTYLTPLVWKRLVLSSQYSSSEAETFQSSVPKALIKANHAARQLLQNYIEYRAGRKMKVLDLIAQFS